MKATFNLQAKNNTITLLNFLENARSLYICILFHTGTMEGNNSINVEQKRKVSVESRLRAREWQEASNEDSSLFLFRYRADNSVTEFN